ncbi:MAG: hypothetical protein ACLTSG_14615 [Lachnospiraceae bacterium]
MSCICGQFLGDSDIDKITDQQNTTNRLEKKIIDKLISSGSFVTLPADACVGVDENDMRVYRPANPADANMIGVYNLEGDVSQDREYLDHIHEEARQIIGITLIRSRGGGTRRRRAARPRSSPRRRLRGGLSPNG